MNKAWSANRWANELTTVLNAVHDGAPSRFPVDVKLIASEFSRQRYPDDPISLIQEAPIRGFEGALYKAPPGQKGWGIFYNDSLTSNGRVNFTLGHEFGHYLLHRQAFPDGIQCSQEDTLRWDAGYREIEQQANTFSAGLLMPLDDFRTQLPSRAKPTLDDLGACADRYGVSLIASALRWLQYTERRAVLVVSRDGYILWPRSSERALRSGAFYRTSGRAPIPIPAASLAATASLADGKMSVEHGPDVWFGEPCEEIALISDRYDFAISLLHLENEVPQWEIESAEPDVYERMTGFRQAR